MNTKSWNNLKHILHFRFFTTATFCLDYCFALLELSRPSSRQVKLSWQVPRDAEHLLSLLPIQESVSSQTIWIGLRFHRLHASVSVLTPCRYRPYSLCLMLFFAPLWSFLWRVSYVLQWATHYSELCATVTVVRREPGARYVNDGVGLMPGKSWIERARIVACALLLLA